MDIEFNKLISNDSEIFSTTLAHHHHHLQYIDRKRNNSKAYRYNLTYVDREKKKKREECSPFKTAFLISFSCHTSHPHLSPLYLFSHPLYIILLGITISRL